MEETIIDTVSASCLEQGDLIRFGDPETLQEVLRFEDDGELITLFLEDDGEVQVHPDLYVNIYGYTSED